MAYSSIKEVPLMFEMLQGSLLAGGITSGAIAATRLQPWSCLSPLCDHQAPAGKMADKLNSAWNKMQENTW